MDHEGQTSDDLIPSRWVIDFKRPELEAGPAVLLHLCAGFPYGNQWAPRSEGAHAVVITGIDTDNNYVTFNNPWGDKDQSCNLAMLLDKINADAGMGKTFGFWCG